MSYKVAVASSDGKVINRHFGRCRQFLVFEIKDDGGWNFLELRENTPPCGFGEHHDDDLMRSVELLSDCGKVLASRVGPGAEQALSFKGIKAYAISGFISDALEKLAEYDRKLKSRKHNP